MRKRFLLLFLCLCLIVVITSACGDGGANTPPSYPFIPVPTPTEPTPTPTPTVSPAPEPTPTPENPFANAQVGDFVEFGHYQQTAEGGDETPIEWQVLARDDNNKLILAISRYGFDAKRFDDDSNVWSSSEICTWLNSDFYNTAFDDTEKGFIKPVGIVFNTDCSDYYDFNSATYNVFLLSKAEAENANYFVDGTGNCKPTDYAVKNGAYNDNNGFGYWWVRTAYPPYSTYVYAYVYSEGDPNEGIVDYFYVKSTYFVARPALWINL